MKIYQNILAFLLAVFFLAACNEGIDPITAVAPGADQSAPVVTIKSPVPDYQLKVPELVSSIVIDFEVTDDIELGAISVKFDGTEIAAFTPSDYKDYRRALEKVSYDNVGLGEHTISIVAADLEGKSTTKTIKISKVSPYTPKYSGEMFYMPFEGDYMEMISFQNAGVVGSPGFANDGLEESKDYAGATDSYLTFPMDNLKFSEFTIGLWVKVNASPDRSGILSIGSTNDDAGRKNGLRLFREGGASSQQIKLNVGTGTGEVWNDGGFINPAQGDWVYVAVTVTPTENIIYLNGSPVRTSAMSGAIDWTGCTQLSIGSGAPTFSYWGHLSDLSHYDNMRIFNRALTAEEIQAVINDDSPYVPKYNGEIFYMPFDGSAKDRVSGTSATTVGSPTYVAGKIGEAYAGATDSYLTYPTAGLQGSEFSAVFWMKINAVPDRAGILVVGPEDTANAGYPDVQNNRTSGFRFFREAGAAGAQRFKLNAGNGTADTWVDGGTGADVDPSVDIWHHLAFTISGSECNVYIDGELVKNSAFTGIDWTGCDVMSIMSGAPRFNEWNHLSDLGMMDELRIFNKALTKTEIETIMNAEK
ncbi:MAG: LamG domain-containing protein [Prolixibacteraceae bacterium]|jgi:hypothetical protein